MRSLSARLLVLTVFFVMLSEVFIFVPSVARFRMTYFDNHLAAAHLASLALAASPNGKLDQPMTNLILRDVGAHAVILHRPNGMVFMLDGPVVPQPDVMRASAAVSRASLLFHTLRTKPRVMANLERTSAV